MKIKLMLAEFVVLFVVACAIALGVTVVATATIVFVEWSAYNLLPYFQSNSLT